MAQTTIKNASGANVTAALVENTGSAADADSLPTAFSTEGKALIGAAGETAPASDTASSGLNGRLQRIAQRITSLIALLPASLGAKAGSGSFSVIPATDAVFRHGTPSLAGTIVSLQTNATGTTYNAFASQACTALDVVNTHPLAVDLEIRRGGSGSTLIIPAGSSRLFVGITNASDLQVRRQDTSNTQITFTAEALA